MGNPQMERSTLIVKSIVKILVTLVVVVGMQSITFGQPFKELQVLVIVGLEGEEEYSDIFNTNINNWKTACATAEVKCRVIGSQKASTSTNSNYRDELKQALTEHAGGELWLVLIGHGSFNGKVAKFNISGEDFTAKELGEWCKGIKDDLVLINTASSSAPFIQALAGKNRTLISATKSANEIYYARFGNYFSEAITGKPEADLDNDEQVSLLEAFLYSSNLAADFYKEQGRLATEHALIDDNGDGLGTRADWFEGTTAVKVAKSGAEPDGLRAMQKVLVKNALEKSLPESLRKRRDELETQVRVIRRKKPEMSDADYYEKLEAILMELAHIYKQAKDPSAK